MTTRREIEQALTGKSSNELNAFFDSLGFYKVNPGGATNEQERREGILQYNLDLADKKPDRFTKICRGLKLPTPQEKMLEIAGARQDHKGSLPWFREHWVQAIVVPLIVTVVGGLILALLL